MTMPKPYFQTTDGAITLYHGDCREILPQIAPESVDLVLTDPPYSARTHQGHNSLANGHHGIGNDGSDRKTLSYDSLHESDCQLLAGLFSDVCRGWIVWMTDHILAPHVCAALETQRYVFAPIPYVAPGSRCRLAGDGPSSWTIWLIAARTSRLSRWGTLPGAYVDSTRGPHLLTGEKPLSIMESLVADYSRPSNTVLDPFAGSGTTLLAARNLGRRAIGIEISEEHCEIAAGRLGNLHPAKEDEPLLAMMQQKESAL